MPYKLHYNDKLALKVWDDAIDKMQHIPYEELLADTRIYLGMHPPGRTHSPYRGYYNPTFKHIVVTERGFYPDSTIFDDETRQYFALRTLLHEIGHHIHYSFLPTNHAAMRNPGLWKGWAEVTDRELDFVRRAGMGNPSIVYSYEHFANDFRDWIMEGPKWDIERTVYYYGLWGQEWISPMKEIEMFIGQDVYFVDGDKKQMDTAPVLQDGRTMVPVRFIADELGMVIGWDAEQMKVTLKKVV